MYMNKALSVAAVLFVSQIPLQSANATTASISVGVAANFSGALTEIINNFVSYSATQNNTYSVSMTSKSTGALKSDIINGTASYDLFLSADNIAPEYLKSSYSSLVVGDTFSYAQGYLELMSNTGATLTNGLPTNFSSVVIADPSLAPYGVAAQSILAATPYSITLPDAKVAELSNITAAYNAAVAKTYPYGFVAKSQICQVVNNVETFSYPHYSYTSGYDDILQDGIKVANTRTSDQEQELTDFITYLLNTSQGGTVITKYCYGTP